MNYYIVLALVSLLCGCAVPPRTTVQIVDKNGHPVEGFPIRFKLDEGVTQSNFLTPVSQSLKKIDDKTYETKTDANGEAGISYYFIDRQPSDWRILLFNAKSVANMQMEVIPLMDIPKGTRIKIGIPNP